MALAALIWFPTRSTDNRQAAIQERKEQEAIHRKKEKKEAIEKAEEKVQKLLREELAEEQLRQFYDELTEDYLETTIAELYWEELLENIETELDEFAEFFEDMEGFDPLEVEQFVEDLKATMLDRLVTIIERDQTKRIVEPILRRAEEVSDQLAEDLEQALKRQVGRPLGENLAEV